MSDARPIGVFDSGVGGLSVWREIRQVLPHEDTLYFADSAHVPYGPRGEAEIRQRLRPFLRGPVGAVGGVARRHQVRERRAVVAAAGAAEALPVPRVVLAPAAGVVELQL